LASNSATDLVCLHSEAFSCIYTLKSEEGIFNFLPHAFSDTDNEWLKVSVRRDLMLCGPQSFQGTAKEFILLFFITPKAAHNRHKKQHNPKHKGKNVHKHTKIIKPYEQKSPRLRL